MTITPGYTSRLKIWFASDKHHRTIAYFRSASGRAIRVSTIAAQQWIAQDQADRI